MGFPFLSMQTYLETLFEHVISCVEFLIYKGNDNKTLRDQIIQQVKY